MTSFKILSLFDNNKDNNTTSTGTLTGILHFQYDKSTDVEPFRTWARKEKKAPIAKKKLPKKTNKQYNHEWPLTDHESTMPIYSPESQLLTKITPSLRQVS